jgi:hypothetical protein
MVTGMRQHLVFETLGCLCWVSSVVKVSRKMAVFWNVVPGSLVETDRRSRGAYCLRLALLGRAVVLGSEGDSKFQDRTYELSILGGSRAWREEREST